MSDSNCYQLDWLYVGCGVQEQFQTIGEQTKEERAQQMKLQMETFKQSLEEFAMKHRQDISKDPIFRAQFQTMCSKIGVDPLASNKASPSHLHYAQLIHSL